MTDLRRLYYQLLTLLGCTAAILGGCWIVLRNDMETQRLIRETHSSSAANNRLILENQVKIIEQGKAILEIESALKVARP